MGFKSDGAPEVGQGMGKEAVKKRTEQTESLGVSGRPKVGEQQTKIETVRRGQTERLQSKRTLEEMEEQIDPKENPLVAPRAGPDAAWERMIRSLEIRTVAVPAAEEQRARKKELLEILDGEPEKPTPELIAQAKSWLQNLPNLLLDQNNFVASSFASHLPAWQKLLQNSKRKSAKSVLSWL